MTEDGPEPAADPERDDRDADEAAGRDARAGPADEPADEAAREADAGNEAETDADPASPERQEAGMGKEQPPDSRTSGRAGPGTTRTPGRELPTGEATDRGAPRPDAGPEESGAADDRPDTPGESGTEGAGAVSAPPATVAAETANEEDSVPEDVRTYDRFKKVDRASYDRVNEFLRDRTYITAREWAIARLCADFRTATGVEMTKIGENLPHLVPFMTDTYTPQAVNQARSAFERKVRMAGATFLYGAMSGFFTADELDELMYEVTEVAKFLLEVEGVELAVEEELDAEDRISAVMREVRQASEELRFDEVACPHCGQAYRPDVEE